MQEAESQSFVPEDNKQVSKSNPSIAEHLSRIFMQSQNLLVFHSPSILIAEGISLALSSLLSQNQSRLILLSQFQDQQIDDINQHLVSTTHKNILNKKDYLRTPPLIIKLNTQTKEKRKISYAKGGLYAISKVIFVVDLLSGDLGTDRVNKVLFRLDRRIVDHYASEIWISTLFKMREWKGSFVVLSKKAQLYSGGQFLQNAYRGFFCRKIVIWPYGRAQIHKHIQSRSHKFEQRQHNIVLSSELQSIQQNLYQLLHQTQTRYNKSYPHRPINALDLLSMAHGRSIFGLSYRNHLLDQMFEIREMLLNLSNRSPHQFIMFFDRKVEASNDKSIFKSVIARLENRINEISKIGTKRILRMVFRTGQKRKISLHSLSDKLNKFRSKELVLEDNLEEHSCEDDLNKGQQLKNSNLKEKEDQVFKDQPPEKVSHHNVNYKQSSQQVIELNAGCLKKSIQIDEQSLLYYLDYDLQCIEDVANKKVQQLVSILAQLETRSDSINSNIQEGDVRKTKVLIFAPSETVGFMLHRHLWSLTNDQSYLAYLRQLYVYLYYGRQSRMQRLQRVISLKKSKRKSHFQIMEQNQIILHEQLYQQLTQILQILQEYGGKITSNSEINAQLLKMFKNRVDSLQCQYVDPTRLSIPFTYSQKNDLNYGKHLEIIVCGNLRMTLSTRILSFQQPHHCVFFSPSNVLLRGLYLLELPSLQSVFILCYKGSFEEEMLIRQITKEDQAFWNISQQRSQLSQYNDSAISRIEELKINDLRTKNAEKIDLSSGLSEAEKNVYIKAGYNSTKLFTINPQRRIIIIDKRQFKSLLPSYLYHFGFEIVPLFLQTADYVISNQIGIQKKSVHTKDLHESLRSGRIDEQLKRMASTFRRPYLLIECSASEEFNAENFGYFERKVGKIGGRSYFVDIRKKIVQLVRKHPKIRLIWSTSIKRSCQYFRQLKIDQLEPDLSKFAPKKDRQFQQLKELVEKQQGIQEQESSPSQLMKQSMLVFLKGKRKSK